MDFLNLNNLKKVTKELNNKANEVWENRIFITHKYFNQIHAVSSGRNSASSLVDFQTKVVEAKSILLTRPFKNYLTIFAYSDITEGQGCRNENLYIEYKDEKGKKHSLDYVDRHNLDRLFNAPKFSENVSFISEEAQWEYERDQKEKYYKSLLDTYNFRVRDFIERIENEGKVEIIKTYVYTHAFEMAHPDVDGYTFRYKNTGTYNTLPEMVSIEVKESMDTVYLYKMGVEEKGYYDHTDKFEILSEQKKEVLNFMKEFNKNKRPKKKVA